MFIFRHRVFLLVLCAVLACAAGVAMAADKDIYYCPMHPQVVSDKPGDCPICHMRLVKREVAQEDRTPLVTLEMQGELTGTFVPAGYASVLISPEKQQLIGIRTLTVQKKALKRSLLTAARVAYDPELYDAQIDYLKEYRMAQGTLRNRELAFKNLQDSRWEAPRIERARSKLLLMGMDDEAIGELVQNAKADESLLYLKPENDVWVFAEVFESEALGLKKGDRVLVQVPSFSDKNYEGMIHSIGSIVDSQTRRIHVHVRLKNDGFLKPQMYVNATIESSDGEALAVPEEAVFFTGPAAIVFVEKGKGLFEPREVRVGNKAGNEYPVISGLTESERVVVNGNFLLDSESRLKASVEKAATLHAGHGAGDD